MVIKQISKIVQVNLLSCKKNCNKKPTHFFFHLKETAKELGNENVELEDTRKSINMKTTSINSKTHDDDRWIKRNYIIDQRNSAKQSTLDFRHKFTQR
jgi:hypothetical protein